MPASLPPRRGQSVDSSDDEKKGPAPPVGGPALSYNLHYIQAENTLILNILEAKNLKKADVLGKPDAFVKVYLLPGSHDELKTKVVKSEMNPQFNETFRFQIPLAEIQRKTLFLQIMDWDRFTKNDPIGEIHIPLNQVDLSTMNREWRSIQPPSKVSKSPRQSQSSKKRDSSSDDEKKSQRRSSSAPSSKGPAELRYRIHYEHGSKTMVLRVMEAQNLPKADLMGCLPDDDVHVYLSQGQKEMRTKTIKISANPVWNEDFHRL